MSKEHIIQVTHHPRNTSSMGCIVQGMHHPRDASSKGCIIQGMHHTRDASSKECKIQGMHRPRNASSKGCIVQGMYHPRDASPKGCIVQATHHPRNSSSKGCIIYGTCDHRTNVWGRNIGRNVRGRIVRPSFLGASTKKQKSPLNWRRKFCPACNGIKRTKFPNKVRTLWMHFLHISYIVLYN